MLHLVDHPVAAWHLTRLRSRESQGAEFRQALTVLTRVLAYAALQDLPTLPAPVETPLGSAVGVRYDVDTVLVPVLRAGLGMVEAFRECVPEAGVAHIGLYRDEATLKPVAYYSRLPVAKGPTRYFLLDPMLATGGSAVEAVDLIKAHGGTDIRWIGVLAAPEGIRRLEAAHPDVPVWIAAIDHGLDGRGYIFPGLGDAGDRQFDAGDG